MCISVEERERGRLQEGKIHERIMVMWTSKENEIGVVGFFQFLSRKNM